MHTHATHRFCKNFGDKFFQSVLAGSSGSEELLLPLLLLRLLLPARSASHRLSKSEKLSYRGGIREFG
jgi:hypothetical protein